MIYALASRRGAFGIGDYLKTDGIASAQHITVLTYEQVFAHGVLPIGSYLFTGLDDLTATETALVNRSRQALAEAAPSMSLLNDPTRFLRRGELLQAAFDAGVNTFRVTRAADHDQRRRYPVYIRSESEHTGALSPLLHTRRAVVRESLYAMLRGYRLRDLLIVEYCHTADAEGVFVKYSAMILGRHVVPRSLTRSREQITKFEGRFADQHAAEADFRYVEENPHEPWLRRMFELGGVEYGRIDYAMLNGMPQLWEINTNPTIGANLAEEEPTTTVTSAAPGAWTEAERRRMAKGNLLSYSKLGVAIESLARSTIDGMTLDGVGSAPVRIPISVAEHACLANERAKRQRILERKTAIGVLVAPLRYAYRLRAWVPGALAQKRTCNRA